jgi:N-acetylglucosamine kinase-like BadF-type ATPase
MYLVGVDGGTTKTIAMVADEHGQILGCARAGGSNWTGEDVEIPMAVVIQTVQAAVDSAGLPGEDIALGVFSLAGADWPEDHTRREAVLSKAAIAQRIIVKNDSFGGLRAGISRPYGMVIAAGTGLNAAVIAPDGREWAFGYYETYGGAHTIAQEAFAAVLRAEDGRDGPTLLTALVLRKLNFPSVEALLRASVLQKIDRGPFLSLCPCVFEAALEGDPAAEQILLRQGRGLAEYAAAMVRRFGMRDLEFEVVLAGSVFKGSGPLLVDTITQEVHRAAPRAVIVRPQFEPVVGSLLMAYDALQLPVTRQMYQELNKSMPAKEFFDTTNGVGYSSIRRSEFIK